MTQLLAGLDPGGNVDFMNLPVEAGYVDLAAKCGCGEADRRAGEEQRPFPLEQGMGLHLHEDVEIARGRPGRARLSLAAYTDASAGIDTGRHGDLKLLDTVHPSFAPARMTRAFDHLAPAMAGRARFLDDEEALLSADLAVPAAKVAAPRGSARLCSRAAAGLAGNRSFDFDLHFLAVKCLVERNLQIVAQIRPAPRPRSAARAAKGVADNRFEDIA